MPNEHFVYMSNEQFVCVCANTHTHTHEVSSEAVEVATAAAATANEMKQQNTRQAAHKHLLTYKRPTDRPTDIHTK